MASERIHIGPWVRWIVRLIDRLQARLLCNNVETPFDITATITGTDVVLAWQGDSANVGVYVVETSINGAAFQVRVFVGAGALPGVHSFAWADTNIDLGGRYCYRITAQHTNGRRGCPADPVCVAGCNGLATPFDVTAIAWGATENRLWWKCDATGLLQYRIERATAGPVGFQSLAVVPAGNQSGVQQYIHSDFGVQGGVLYCYRIASERMDGGRGCFTGPVCAGSQYI